MSTNSRDASSSGPSSGQLNNEQLSRYFSLLARDIRDSTPALEDESVWQVAAGSPFAGDDRKMNPYQISHSARSLIGSSMDHLGAVVDLIEHAAVLRPMAPFTLVRGALETASAAVWMMAPASRPERVARRLRYAAMDLRDGRRVVDGLGLPSKRPQAELHQQILDLAAAAGIDAERMRGRLLSTEVIDAASEETRSVLRPAVAWRVCSGIAHGRQWTSLSFLDRVEVPTVDVEDGVTTLRVTAGMGQLVWALGAAVDTMRSAGRLYRQRAHGI